MLGHGLTGDRQGKRDVFCDGQVIKKLAVLMHNANSPAQMRDAITIKITNIRVKEPKLALCGNQCPVAQFEKGGFA